MTEYKNIVEVFEKTTDWNVFVPEDCPIEFLEFYKDRLNWQRLFKHRPSLITEEVFLKFKYLFDTNLKESMLYCLEPSDCLIDALDTEELSYLLNNNPLWSDKVSKKYLSYNYLSGKGIDKKDLEKFGMYLSWLSLKNKLTLPSDFVLDNLEMFTHLGKLLNLLKNIVYTNEQISKYFKLFSTEELMNFPSLSEDLVERLISERFVKPKELYNIKTPLSAEQIRKYMDKSDVLNVTNFTIYQIAKSEDLILEMWDDLNELSLYMYDLVDMDFIIEHKDIINFHSLFEATTRGYDGDLKYACEFFKNEYEDYLNLIHKVEAEFF